MGAANYVEFNSDVLTEGQSRRIRLYQVAAIIGTRNYYDNIPTPQIQAWIREYSPEASHLCRWVDYSDVADVNPDGTYVRAPTVKENKRCFAPDHMILESARYNRSRIACFGGDGCRHEPRCIQVARPE